MTTMVDAKHLMCTQHKNPVDEIPNVTRLTRQKEKQSEP